MNQQSYQDFFKAARKARLGSRPEQIGKAKSSPSGNRSSAVRVRSGIDEMSEAELRKVFGLGSGFEKRRKKNSLIWLISMSFFGLLIAGGVHFFPELLDGEFPQLELTFFSGAQAEENGVKGGKTATEQKSNNEKSQNQEPTGKAPDGEIKDKPPRELSDVRKWTDDEIKFLSRLDERKRELDAREQSLQKMEESLRVQTTEIEKKIQQLDEIRKQIAEKLEHKVEVDQERVNKLVDFYSNMKAQNAAKVFETIDEDLAVEVLIRMKKKNAADIMNLLPAEKSQILSEKFAGYRNK